MWLHKKVKKNGFGFEAEILFPETAEEDQFSCVVVHKKGRKKPVAQKKIPLHYPANAHQKNPKKIDVWIADIEAEDLLNSAIRKEKKKREERKKSSQGGK